MSDNPYRAPQSSRGGLTLGDEPLQFAQTPQERNAGPSGLGGWLIVIGIKLAMTVIQNADALIRDHLPVYRDGLWEDLVSPGTALYHPMAGPTMLFETAGNVMFMAAGVALLAMFFRKAPSFPRWMMALLLGNVAFLSLDMYLLSQMPHLLGNQGPEAAMDIAKGCVGAIIWVPYLLMSKRVRNTFVHKRVAAKRTEPRWDTTADEAATR